MSFVRDNMAPLMFGGMILFMLTGYPAAFCLAATGLVFAFIGIELGLIVPGFLFAEHPELAIDVDLVRQIAERLGATAEVVDIDSRGLIARNGRLPINTHGGLLSHGYPGRAAGIGNLIEAVVQLRGEAGVRQIPNARMTMTHGMGGLFATHGVLLLEAV